MKLADAQAQERIREYVELQDNLLGPREGASEILSNARFPSDEYITGVLGHKEASPMPESEEANFDLSSSDINRGTLEEEDPIESDSQAAGTSQLFSPSVDGRLLPRSLGISFVVTVNGDSWLDVLATWGTYEATDSGWERSSNHILKTGVVFQSDEELANLSDAKLVVRVRKHNTSHIVSIFLINDSAPEGDDETWRDESLCMFQPEIRINLGGGARLEPIGSHSLESESDVLSAPQYRDRLAFAKGHLVGAVWADIDWQGRLLDNAVWSDSPGLDKDDSSAFLIPDVRTDYLPSYHVPAPDLSWNTAHGPSPELSPAKLAECNSPSSIETALRPFVDGYRSWIELQTPNGLFESADNSALKKANISLDRLEFGIQLLKTDERARLAFCFANKAIALQSKWQRGSDTMSWYPFQLAFILQTLKGITDPSSEDRKVCDLLWVPTGGGKTEAYLGVMAFVMAYRRLSGNERDFGPAVFSRYTLRLLTIQQFRRTTRLVTACEYLRVTTSHNRSRGWVPADNSGSDWIWGTKRFSIGLWVGAGVTPNRLQSLKISYGPTRSGIVVGAIDLLRGASRQYDGPDIDLKASLKGRDLSGTESEPAQLTHCPACDSFLSITNAGLPPGNHRLSWVVGTMASGQQLTFSDSTPEAIKIQSAQLNQMVGARPGISFLSIDVEIIEKLGPEEIDRWFYKDVLSKLGRRPRLFAARPSRMGYQLMDTPQGLAHPVAWTDFEVICPESTCPLGTSDWEEHTPSRTYAPSDSESTSGTRHRVPEAFQSEINQDISTRIPIPVCMTDDQVVARCPSITIGTVDKLARLAYDPASAGIFGNVDRFSSLLGYYRSGVLSFTGASQSTSFQQKYPHRGGRGNEYDISVPPFNPPELIVQDELHLIDGPLGSMVGAYEIIVDLLSSQVIEGTTYLPKYIASSATVNRAEDQVRSVFNRALSVFPSPGPTYDDSFYVRHREVDPDEPTPGRLYVGVSCIGRGAITPMVRVWSSLLQGAQDGIDHWQNLIGSDPEANYTADQVIDPMWTLVGYFNAIRELNAGRAIFAQDVPQRILGRYGQGARQLNDEPVELSSGTSSELLPGLLSSLENPLSSGSSESAVLTTSMFGTGVDIERLGLMVVAGQPKSSSSYIQATGRVGRGAPGLVVTVLRPTRPRDLNHFEFFTGYHRALHRWVEPITVAPFASRTRDRTLGPIQVALLRNAQSLNGTPVSEDWRVEQRLARGKYQSAARRMANHRQDPEVVRLTELLESRAQEQPESRRPLQNQTAQHSRSLLDRWMEIASRVSSDDEVVYFESTFVRNPTRDVILGDSPHRMTGKNQAFENAPNSLRDVEDTTGIKII